MSKKKIQIAAFDFDGTITDRDTFSLFLVHAAGFKKVLSACFKNFFLVILFFLKKVDRQELKESFLTDLFRGLKHDQIVDMGKKFAKGPLQRRLKPKALEKIVWHQKQSHRCILVSASLREYLSFWADEAGFDDVVSSSLAIDSNGCVMGKLKGLNCRGEEKVKRLIQLLGPLEKFEIWAYGDSDGDKELLQVADHSFFRPF